MANSVKSTSSSGAQASRQAGPAKPRQTAGEGRTAPFRIPKWWFAVGAAILALLVGVYIMVASGRRRAEFAQRALDQARGAAETGNLPAASGQFQNVIDTYGGTEAAQQAVLGLNQIRLINGQAELAIAGLREFVASDPDPEYLPAGYGLLGVALENAGRPAEAAEAYENAAENSEFDFRKAEYLLDAGRAYQNAGQTEAATGAYRRIVDQYPATPSFTEAQLRLAELTDGAL